MLIMLLSPRIYYVFTGLLALILIKWSSDRVRVMVFIFRNLLCQSKFPRYRRYCNYVENQSLIILRIHYL